MNVNIEFHLEILQNQIREAVRCNDPRLITILRLCSRLLTPKQLARLKFKVMESKMSVNFNHHYKWDLPAKEPKHRDPERYGVNHPRNKEALDKYDEKEAARKEREYWDE